MCSTFWDSGQVCRLPLRYDDGATQVASCMIHAISARLSKPWSCGSSRDRHTCSDKSSPISLSRSITIPRYYQSSTSKLRGCVRNVTPAVVFSRSVEGSLIRADTATLLDASFHAIRALFKTATCPSAFMPSRVLFFCVWTCSTFRSCSFPLSNQTLPGFCSYLSLWLPVLFQAV